MCHGRIAPKSTSASAVASVGHGVFLPLVILSTLLGDGLASGESWPSAIGLWEGKDTILLFLLKAGIGNSLSVKQLQGEQGGGLLCCGIAGSQYCWFGTKGPNEPDGGQLCRNLLVMTLSPLFPAVVIRQDRDVGFRL